MKLHLLLSPAFATGLFLALLLFAFCFFGVHLCILAQIGFRQTKQSPPKPIEEEKKAPPKVEPAQPIYYIVERKKRAPKTTYSEPKRITFK